MRLSPWNVAKRWVDRSRGTGTARIPASLRLRSDVWRCGRLAERRTHLIGRQHTQQAVAPQVAQRHVSDFDRGGGGVIWRLEEREAIVLGTRRVIQPQEAAAQVLHQGCGSRRAVLRGVDEL